MMPVLADVCKRTCGLCYDKVLQVIPPFPLQFRGKQLHISFHWKNFNEKLKFPYDNKLVFVSRILYLVDCKWGSYEAWSSCSKTCGGGEKTRTRQVDTPASNGGQACGGNTMETEACDTYGCPMNCEWGSYGEWSSCSHICGAGTRSKTRSKLVEEVNGGSCSGDAPVIEECNTRICSRNK